MRAMRETELASEWSLLQNQFDSYEKYSLLIKLASVLIVSWAYMADTLDYFLVFLILVLWVQDAIWKTFQGRIEVRLLQLESCLQKVQKREGSEDAADNLESLAYQFNSVYQRERPSQIGLIVEYGAQAIRPTVAFPYVALLAASVYRICL